MTYLVAGCPVYGRDWIIGAWFDHIEDACRIAGIAEPHYAFVIDEADTATIDAINEACERHRRIAFYFAASQADGDDGHRGWNNRTRILWLTQLRNWLLGVVRPLQPDWFLSLDSDILLHPSALELGIGAAQERHFDAVGLKAYLSPSDLCPNYCQLISEGHMHRPDHEGVIPADVIMAAKLMSPTAYAIDYEFDHRGEDLGWSRRCKEAGLKLGHDGRVASKHVMRRDVRLADGSVVNGIDQVDARVGY